MNTVFARVDAQMFREALGRVYQIAARQATLPILGEALVRFDGSSCTIICTNLNQWCLATLPASGDSFSLVFTKTKSLLTACRHFSGQLELQFSSEPTDKAPDPDGQITVSDGTRSLTQRTWRASDFPMLPEADFTERYPIDAEKLLERFKRVRYAVSVDTNRPARCCVEFVDQRIVTLDGYRLALSADPALTVKTPFFIPVEAMSELQMFKGQSCTLCVGEKYASFENEALRLLTRIPENDHLDIDHMIPSRLEEEFLVPVEPLWAEVKYLSEAASKKDRKPIRFNGQTMELETSDGLYSAKVGLPPITVRGFNPRYLLEGFGQFKAKKTPTVTMKVGHPHSPIILTDDESDLAMVLPVRLKAA